MEDTLNYGFKKHDKTEFFTLNHANENLDLIDAELKIAQDKADQAFQSASNGKTAIKAAITGVDPEVTIPTEATFSQLATAIGQIKTGIDTEDATATAEQILAGMTAYVKGVKVTGTMTNRGAVNITPGTANQAIPKGYHNGNGMVAGDSNLVSGNIKAGVSIFGKSGKSSVVDTADANVTAGQMLTGYSGYANGNKINGNIPITDPIVSSDIIDFYNDGGAQAFAVPMLGVQSAFIRVKPYSYISAANWVRHPEPDLIPQNILVGKSIFGVLGSARRSQSGIANSGNMSATFTYGSGGTMGIYYVAISGLTFTPSIILMLDISSYGGAYMVVYRSDGMEFSAYPNVKIAVAATTYSTTGYANSYGFIVDGTGAYVNSTGFRLPYPIANRNIFWIAVE